MKPSRASSLLAGALIVALSIAIMVLWARQTGAHRATLRAKAAAPGSTRRLDALNRALAINPAFHRALALRSGEALTRGQIESAWSDAQQAAPGYDSVDFTLQRGAIARRRGDIETSIELFERARHMQPDRPETLIQLAATTLYMKNDPRAAAVVARELNERSPDNVDALALLGECARRQGAASRARFYFQRTIDLLRAGAEPTLPLDAEALRQYLE